jgi:hypothetical protein
MWESRRTSLLYIVCNMGFEDKTYGLNVFSCFLFANEVTIELQL